MTPINQTRRHNTAADTSRARRGADGRRRVRLAYDGVTAAYIRDISRRDHRPRAVDGSSS